MEVTRAGWQVCTPSPPTPTQGTDQRLDGERRQQPPGGRHKLIRSQSVSSVRKSSKPGTVKQSPESNARERHRVRNLRQAFLSLQAALPSVPPDTKLSKLDVLILATSYIAHLTHTLDQGRHLPGSCQMGRGPGYLHPMKKWPMRARLYAETPECELSAGCDSHKN